MPGGCGSGLGVGQAAGECPFAVPQSRPSVEFDRDSVYLLRQGFSPRLNLAHPGDVGPVSVAHLLALALELGGHVVPVFIAEELLAEGADRVNVYP